MESLESNEFRIGNLANIGYDCEVVGVDKLGLRLANYTWANESNYFDYKKIQPIHLNEEWLSKFGFRKTNDELYFLPIPNLGMEIHAVFFHKTWVIELSNSRRNIVTEAAYVHQLQNLYHALTLKELELTSPINNRDENRTYHRNL